MNEANPIGILLYKNFGSAGLIFTKTGLFIIFASLMVFFLTKYPTIKWFVELCESLVLIQIAISLIVTFNNFIAILAVLYVHGQLLPAYVSKEVAVTLIYLADLGLGATFANGIMYMWGVKAQKTHLRVFTGLLLFITPLLLFSEGFRTYLWLFGIYVASASTSLGIGFYITESAKIRKANISPAVNEPPASPPSRKL